MTIAGAFNDLTALRHRPGMMSPGSRTVNP